MWKEHFLGICPFIRLSKGQMVPLTSLVVPCWQTRKTKKKKKKYNGNNDVNVKKTSI
jgi:hypothetical protein